MEIYIKIYIYPENYGNVHLLWKYTLKYGNIH